MAISRNDLMKQLLPGMNKVFEEAYGKYQAPPYILHMKAKGRWQILKWGEVNGEHKYRVNADHLTYRQAKALIKIY